MSSMSDALTIVCPNCGALNRVPMARLAAEKGQAVCGKCGLAHLFAGRPIALDSEARFDRHIGKSGIPVLVDFWAPWCRPCLMMAPFFEDAAARLEPRLHLAKVNTEAVPMLGQRFGVRAIPTMILFSGGREVARQSGALQLPGILRFVETHLGQAAA
jgi:thioredoxin 2